ncbi:hypothetical protein FIBSPDRAFT_926502 [Athelia psychrophila]|uniref:Uncharacterized protein n=1 Tax=Athelia psychrophila TaxID=1759441 RepID=A0A166T871_9AGAM|nr:hypothetical protein FIBSPDRAFT_926502 [Fibularhizoctonia sp. CBS 109695]
MSISATGFLNMHPLLLRLLVLAGSLWTLGIGATTASSPMVIVWPNSADTVTLSQRMATVEVFAHTTVGSKPSLVHTVSSISAQPVIRAILSGTSPDAMLMLHVDPGAFTLDLTLPISSNSTTPTTTSAGDPVHRRNMMIVDYGTLCAVGILGLLPLGVLIAR